MRYLHTGDIILNKLNAEEVLRAADFLQINNIIPKCVDFLAQHTFGDDKVFTLREIFHSIPTLVSRATEYIQVISIVKLNQPLKKIFQHIRVRAPNEKLKIITKLRGFCYSQAQIVKYAICN